MCIVRCELQLFIVVIVVMETAVRTEKDEVIVYAQNKNTKE